MIYNAFDHSKYDMEVAIYIHFCFGFFSHGLMGAISSIWMALLELCENGGKDETRSVHESGVKYDTSSTSGNRKA